MAKRRHRRKRKQTAKQRAASLRNLKKARLARRRKAYRVVTRWIDKDSGDHFDRVHTRRAHTLAEARRQERAHNQGNLARGMAEDGFRYRILPAKGH